MDILRLIDKVEPEVMFEAEWETFPSEIQATCVKQRYLEHYAAQPSIGFAVGDRCVGGVIMDHGFIHVSILPEFYGKFSLVYLPALEWAFSHADPIYGMAFSENRKCIRFAEHSGWERVGHFGGIDFFRSTKQLLEKLRARRARLLAKAASR